MPSSQRKPGAPAVPRRTQRERIFAIAAIVILVAAWITGSFRHETDLVPALTDVLPNAETFHPTNNGTFTAWDGSTPPVLLGYVRIGAADGYGGEMRVAAAVDTNGTVIGVYILSHKETASFLRRVLRRDFVTQLSGKRVTDAFTIGQDVEGVTGATYTCRAIAVGVRRAGRQIVSKHLGWDTLSEPSPPVQFGLPEIVLLALFIIGVLGRLKRFPYVKAVRWISMIAGLIFLGFLFDKPLTLAIVNKFLLGYWPQWQQHLYWYILAGGILVMTAAAGKNPYCDWFCPFGAAQDCLGLMGGAKNRTPERFREAARWFQRLLALAAIVLALVMRNPSVSSYEIFGVFFRLIGSDVQFAILGLIMVASLFIKRPWCRYLCPILPVTDFIRLMRNWIRDVVKRHFRGN